MHTVLLLIFIELVRGNCRHMELSIVRNSVDTRHGLSTRHTRVMENSRGKSRRRDGTLENSVRRSRSEETREGERRCKRESREKVRHDSPFTRLILPRWIENALTGVSDLRLSMSRRAKLKMLTVLSRSLLDKYSSNNEWFYRGRILNGYTILCEIYRSFTRKYYQLVL